MIQKIGKHKPISYQKETNLKNDILSLFLTKLALKQVSAKLFLF